jgi:hypothetical protein
MKPDPATVPGRNCADLDPDLFFPAANDLKGLRAAKRLCHGCPALVECLEFALALERGTGHSGRSGVFGGTTPRQRAKIHTDRRRAAA